MLNLAPPRLRIRFQHREHPTILGRCALVLNRPQRRCDTLRQTRSAGYTNSHSSSATSSCGKQHQGITKLLRKLDLSPQQQNKLLGYLINDNSTKDLVSKNLELLLNTYNRARVKQLVLSHPSLLSSSLYEWYSFLQGYGFSSEEVYNLANSNAAHITHLQLFSAGQVLMFLQQYGLDPAEIRTSVVMRHPQVLSISPDHLQLLAACLQRDLGCTPTDLHQLFLTHPKVLSCSIRSDIRAKIQHLHHFGLEPASLHSWAPACISKFISEPQESVLGKLQYFDSIGISSGHLHDLLVACPTIWTLAVTDIMDKWTFLTKVMGGGLPDVLQYPEFLEKDLMCCIRPRALLLEARSVGGESIGQLQGGCGSLDLAWMLGCDDQEFSRRAGISTAQYLEFYNALVANQYYGTKAAIDVFDRPEPRRG